MLSRFLYFILTLVLMAGCANSDSGNLPDTANAPASSKTTIKWVDSVQNIGRVIEGQKVAISFRFKNTGKVPLVIESVTPSCGCTVADFNREPIAPGADDEISASFDSEGRPGLQHKEITVKANTPGFGLQHLFFNIEVVPKPSGSGKN